LGFAPLPLLLLLLLLLLLFEIELLLGFCELSNTLHGQQKVNRHTGQPGGMLKQFEACKYAWQTDMLLACRPGRCNSNLVFSCSPHCQLQALTLPGWCWQQHSVLLQVLLLLDCRAVPAQAMLTQLFVHL
jgi:hypothetical protein